MKDQATEPVKQQSETAKQPTPKAYSQQSINKTASNV